MAIQALTKLEEISDQWAVFILPVTVQLDYIYMLTPLPLSASRPCHLRSH